MNPGGLICLVWFSRVVFNRAIDMAVVYFAVAGSMPLDAEGTVILLKKGACNWAICRRHELWRS